MPTRAQTFSVTSRLHYSLQLFGPGLQSSAFCCPRYRRVPQRLDCSWQRIGLGLGLDRSTRTALLDIAGVNPHLRNKTAVSETAVAAEKHCGLFEKLVSPWHVVCWCRSEAYPRSSPRPLPKRSRRGKASPISRLISNSLPQQSMT